MRIKHNFPIIKTEPDLAFLNRLGRMSAVVRAAEDRFSGSTLEQTLQAIQEIKNMAVRYAEEQEITIDDRLFAEFCRAGVTAFDRMKSDSTNYDQEARSV